jgi:hypothetical protein
MRTVLASVVCASAAILTTGCTVHTYSRPVVVERRPVVVEERHVVQADVVAEPETPVIVDAAPTEVLRIDVEPAPAERVYVYEPGFPPGTYLYGGFYYYGGYRYHHDIFIHRYVEVNVRERRYVNVVENRRLGHVVEERHRTEFVKYGAHHESHPSVQRAIHETKTVHTTHAEPAKTVHTDPKTHVADGHNLKQYEEKKTVETTEKKKKVTKEEEHR